MSPLLAAAVTALLLAVMAAAQGSTQSRTLCQSAAGRLELAPASLFVMTIETGPVPTAFINSQQDAYNVTCHRSGSHFNHGSVPRIDFELQLKEDRLQNVYASASMTSRSISPKFLQRQNQANYKKIRIRCSVLEEGSEGSSDAMTSDVCSVDMVVLSPFPSSNNCTFNRTLSCNVSDWLGQINPMRHKTIRTKMASSKMEPSYQYFIFQPDNQTWVLCNELVKNGERAKSGLHLDHHTESISCPIMLGHQDASRPVMIKVESQERSGFSVGLPAIMGRNNTDQSTYTYFAVYVDSIVFDDNSSTRDELFSVQGAVILGVCLACSLLIALVALLYFLRYRMKADGSHAKGQSQFYLEETWPANKEPIDNISMNTQFTNYDRIRAVDTNAQAKMADLFAQAPFIFGTSINTGFVDDQKEGESDGEGGAGDEDDVFNWDVQDEAAVTRRKTIVARQLSGDPAKLNPRLSLNQQANALPYNTKHEIDRCNFSVGQLLGSGNFGSVFVGEAVGLFHPGDVTKVAIKTVNDPLDRAQLMALLCELKILGSLDFHLNLVNLMGSCTSQMHNGELWLLLEYCAHGDMKSFLLKHRSEFVNNIKGLCATGLDARLFLTWAYSIAKGMEYLTSKRIMHGDLAARNVLIAGNDDQLVAKVSDFGLSKTFYDNTRYKKKFRHYVPWKWMAIEYLKDACFNMKSDVWSYGVVLWEILSIGQEPYSGKSVDEMVSQIKSGYRLPCPDTMDGICWAQSMYTDVMRKCWDTDPTTRCSFSEIVNVLQWLMDAEELCAYDSLTQRYNSMKELIANDGTRLQRMSSSSSSFTSHHNYHQPSPLPLHSLPAGVNCAATATGYISLEQALSKISSAPAAHYVSLDQARLPASPSAHTVQLGY